MEHPQLVPIAVVAIINVLYLKRLRCLIQDSANHPVFAVIKLATRELARGALRLRFHMNIDATLEGYFFVALRGSLQLRELCDRARPQYRQRLGTRRRPCLEPAQRSFRFLVRRRGS